MPTITDYELFHVPPRWVFLRIDTSDGRIGWGEPIVEGRAQTVSAAVCELLDTYLLGEDPARIRDHWQTMYRGGFYRGGPILMSALAGIDQALWDLKGKAHDTPVSALLGGRVRDRIRYYRWIGGDDPSAVGDHAAQLAADGVTAAKMNATGKFNRIETPAAVTEVTERVAAVQDAVPSNFNLGLDFHGRVAKSMVDRLADAVEPFDPMFIEEPVLPEHNDVLTTLSTPIPIATGERMFSRWDFKSVLNTGSVDIIQPDPSHAGGITELTRIADMAEAYDVAVAPHCPLGPVALAAALQVDAVAQTAVIQESSLGIHYNDAADIPAYLVDQSRLAPTDGYLEIPTGPGLGIELDEAALRNTPDPDWHNPVWRYDDGSIAEW